MGELFGLFLALASLGSNQAMKEPDVQNDCKEMSTMVSYVGVMKKYYDIAVADNENPCETFECFLDDYYSRPILPSIYDYVLDFSERVGTFDYVNSILRSPNSTTSQYSLISGGGGGETGESEDYILTSNEEYDITPASYFARTPFYGLYDYSNVEMGDIIFEANGSTGSITGHCAFITDVNHGSAYGNYIQTIEAVNPKVARGFLDDNRMVQFKACILRPTDQTYYAAISAKSFVINQLGKPYNIHHSTNTSMWSSNWYCSELVYAAYMFTYIDLGNGSSQVVNPYDILYSPNTYILEGLSDYLEFQIIGKSGTRWSIEIKNLYRTTATGKYNTKMCFENDARNWNLSSDTANISISSGGSARVTISENLFAGCVAAYAQRTINNVVYRVISYGKNLNNSTKTMKQYYLYQMI